MLGIVHKGDCVIQSRGRAAKWSIHIPCPSQVLPSMNRHKSLSNLFRSISDHLQIKPIHSSSLLRVSAQLTFRHSCANLTAASSLLQPPSAVRQWIAQVWAGSSELHSLASLGAEGWHAGGHPPPSSLQSTLPCHSKLALPLARVFYRITYSKESSLRAHLMKCPQWRNETEVHLPWWKATCFSPINIPPIAPTCV